MHTEPDKKRCEELAALSELHCYHWEELTGVGIGKWRSYTVSQDGVFPTKYSDDDLAKLTPEESRALQEHGLSKSLPFSCSPAQSLQFVGGRGRFFDLPDDFIAAVESKAPLVQKAGHPNLVDETKPHYAYLVKLLQDNPSATAKDILKLCLKLVDTDTSSPFQKSGSALVLRGKTSQFSDKTFGNWMTKARKLL